MLKSGLVLLAVAAGYPSASTAQQSGWEPNQVNATMCYWEQLRGLSSMCPACPPPPC